MKEMVTRRTTKEEYHKSALLKEVSWRQKSRKIEPKEKDKKKKISIKMIKCPRRKNLLAKIKVNRKNLGII